MSQDEGGTVDGFDDFGHRESLAGASDAEEDLVLLARIHAADELFDGGGLIATRLVTAAQLEFHEKSLLLVRRRRVKPPLYPATQIRDDVTSYRRRRAGMAHPKRDWT